MSCPEGQYFCNDKQKCMPIPKGHKVRKDGELVKEAVKGQDTETRKEMAAERKAGDKKKSVKAGESYATFQKQRIKWADQTSKAKKHMHGSIDETIERQAKDRKKLSQPHSVSGSRRDHSHDVDSALTDHVPRKGKGRMRPASKKEMRVSAMREDKAFDNVVGALRKKYGKDAVLTKDSPRPKPQPRPKAKPDTRSPEQKKKDQEQANIDAQYGGRANRLAGRGLGT